MDVLDGRFFRREASILNRKPNENNGFDTFTQWRSWDRDPLRLLFFPGKSRVKRVFGMDVFGRTFPMDAFRSQTGARRKPITVENPPCHPKERFPFGAVTMPPERAETASFLIIHPLEVNSTVWTVSQCVGKCSPLRKDPRESPK